jgi:hypothetical protein
MSNNNSGINNLNGDAAGLPQKTILVLGAGRGGTSMVAGTLAKLGIYMGESLSSYYEDGILANCVTANDKQQARNIIAARNEKYPVWGFKKPSLRLWFWLDLFRQPVYIVVFRDIFATANRRVISLDKSLLAEMFKIALINLGLVTLLRFSKRPAFILSYEKALLAPEQFVGELCDFLGMSDNVKFNDAVEFIKPSPTAYTRRAKTQSQLDADLWGYVDIVESQRVSGWALSLSDSEALEVELLINGKHRKTMLANIPRADVALKDSRFRKECGFRFQFPKHKPLKTGDKIEVRLVKDKTQLINSPQTFVAQ